MKTPSQHCTHMIVTEDSAEGKEKIVAFGRWFRYGEGEFEMDWSTRWEPELPEDMKVEIVGDVFFDPMARQRSAVMGQRPHYFLEVLATDTEYQKKGLGSRLLAWICEKADSEGLELYLDAGKGAQSLYEKFGFMEQADKKDPKAVAPMLRLAKKKEE